MPSGLRRPGREPDRASPPPCRLRRGSRTRPAPSVRRGRPCAGANVLHDFELREPRHDVADRGGEGGVGRRELAALNQDALRGRALEARVENPVHPARLARPGGVRVDRLRTGHAECEGDDDKGEPAERRRLPVVGAPATHSRREVLLGGRCGHFRPPSRDVHFRHRRYGGRPGTTSSEGRVRAPTRRRFRLLPE